MTRAQFRKEAQVTMRLIRVVDAAREFGSATVGDYCLSDAILALIVDLDFDWYWFLRTGKTEPDTCERGGNCTCFLCRP